MKEKKEKAVKEKPVRKKRAEKESAAAEQINSGAVNYNVYHMSKGEKLLYILLAGALLYGLGYIFYQNVIISLLFSLLALKYPSIRTRAIIRKRKRQLTMQFKDMLYSLSSAVSAGNSVERALVIARDDMVSQYGESNVFIVQDRKSVV